MNDTLSLKDLKELIKIFKIKDKNVKCIIPDKCISKCKKEDLLNILKIYISTRKIQQFLRKKWSLENVCPVSLEPIKYPLFAFKPKGLRQFIYYNLEIYGNYLISTGDFRDPKTREVYSDDVLKNIDKEIIKNSIKLDGPLKGVYSASKNKKYYRNKKEIEDNLLVLDRCLDEIISSLRSWVENRRPSATNTQNILFMAFQNYFKRLCSYSKTEAHNLITRTIISINNSVKNQQDTVSSNNRDHVIQFLYQIQFDELDI